MSVGGRRRSLAVALCCLLVGGVLSSAPGRGTAIAADAGVAAMFRTGYVVNDFVVDRGRDLIYATVAAESPAFAGELVTIDPRTAQVVAHVAVGTVPGALALSADGSALFVGVDGQLAVKKLSLPGFATRWTHPVGGLTSTFSSFAGDLAAMPGSSDVVAVALKYAGLSPSHAGVVIIDGDGPRPNITPGHIGSDSIAFGPDGTLYGSTNESGDLFRTHLVDAQGVSITHESKLGGGSIEFVDGLVYVSNGRIVDVRGPTPVLADTLADADGIAVEPVTGRLLASERVFDGGFVPAIAEYDPTTRIRLRGWKLPDFFGFARHVTSLGNGRLAFVDRAHPMVRPGHLTLVDLNDTPSLPSTPPPVTPPSVPPTTGPAAPAATVPTVPTAPVPSVPTEPTDDEDFGSLGEYTPLTPQRILDTRTGSGRGGIVGPLGPNERIDVQVTGVGGVPSSGVDTVVLNVTAVLPTQSGYLTVYPSGLARPLVSSLNFSPSITVANLVTMPVGLGGKVAVFNPFGDVDVLFDVAGYYSSETGPDGLRFHSLEPSRAMDTRIGLGGRSTPLGPQQTEALRIAGAARVPRNAVAVVLNVTVTGATEQSHVSIFPSDVTLPTVSNLNFGRGATLANQVIVKLSNLGSFSMYNHAGSTDVVVDVVGYFDDVEVADDGRFLSFQPIRVVDTREWSPFAPPGEMWPGNIAVYDDDSLLVQAYVMNVTVTDTKGSGYVTAFPYSDEFDSDPPMVSTLNYTDGATVPNHAIVPAAPYVAFFNAGGRAQLVVDVVGFFI